MQGKLFQRSHQNWARSLTLGTLLAVIGCGGGGGGNGNDSFDNNLDDPTILVAGPTGQYSLTPMEANARITDRSTNALDAPPSLPVTVSGENHYFRLAMPFKIDPTTLLDATATAFSTLNGQVTVTDQDGFHIPGIVLINGIDADGVDRSGEVGFPEDIDTRGQNRNLEHGDRNGVRRDVLLYIADDDDDLSTFTAFTRGGESVTSPLSFVNITLGTVNGGVTINGRWTISIGADTTPPRVEWVRADRTIPDPANPGQTLVDVNSSFVMRFNKPMIPETVGQSAFLNGMLAGEDFNANLPVTGGLPPNPHVTLTMATNIGASTLNIPYDVEPLNTNNLTRFRFTPIVPLIPNNTLRFRVRAFSAASSSGTAATDIFGNAYNGQADIPNIGGGNPDVVLDFQTAEGPGIVNIPVSPEVVYWLPQQGRGVGAIDLNGFGFTTNTPGAKSDRPEDALIITTVGRFDALIGRSLDGIPVGPADHNQYSYPVGTGSFLWGDPTLNPGSQTPDFVDPTDPGNPGTPFPGVNEGSSGFETLCRDSNGSVILTGETGGEIGIAADLAVGEFLDTIYFDKTNFNASVPFRDITALFGGTTGGILFGNTFTVDRNLIAVPPTPNPPPMRYWVGLPQLDVVIDQADPVNSAFLIEGAEVFPNTTWFQGWQVLRPNPENPGIGPDVTIFPHANVGPRPELSWTSTGSGTGIQFPPTGLTYGARQQIGNFLYVTDVENRLLHAVNSNNMRVINSIPLPDPNGLGIAPNSQWLYVSNFGDDTLSVVDTDPLSPTFHTEISRIKTGRGPRSVAVQPDFEDVYVCDFLGDTITIIDPESLSVRKTLTQLLNGPFDISLTGRQGNPSSIAPFGFQSGIFFGYVSNLEGNSLVVLESGPDGPQGIGIDNVRGEIPTGDEDPPIIAPRGLCYSPFKNSQNFDAGGVFVAHRDEEGFGRVSHVQFTNQAQFGVITINQPPGSLIPPGFTERNFEVVAAWGQSNDNRLAGFIPTDVTLADMTVEVYQANPAQAPNQSLSGSPVNPIKVGTINSRNHFVYVPPALIPVWQPDRLYVSFQDADVVQVLDPSLAGVIINETDSAKGGIKKLMTFYHQ